MSVQNEVVHLDDASADHRNSDPDADADADCINTDLDISTDADFNNTDHSNAGPNDTDHSDADHNDNVDARRRATDRAYFCLLSFLLPNVFHPLGFRDVAILLSVGLVAGIYFRFHLGSFSGFYGRLAGGYGFFFLLIGQFSVAVAAVGFLLVVLGITLGGVEAVAGCSVEDATIRPPDSFRFFGFIAVSALVIFGSDIQFLLTVDGTTTLFAISAFFSLCTLVYHYNRCRNLSYLPGYVAVLSYIFLINCGYYLTSSLDFSSSIKYGYQMMLILWPLFLIVFGFWYRDYGRLAMVVGFTLILQVIAWYTLLYIVMPIPCVETILTLLYCAVLPMTLSVTTKSDGFSSIWNIFIYLSLLLPTINFCCGWFSYYHASYWMETMDVKLQLFGAIIAVLIFLNLYTSLATNMMETKLKYTGWFVLTLIISFGVIGIIYRVNPSSVDRHGWVMTPSGLIAKDQAIVDQIQAIYVDMSKCGQYDNATETLSRIIDKYTVYDLQTWLRRKDYFFLKYPLSIFGVYDKYEMTHKERFRKTFGKLYSLRGLLLYRHEKYKEALDDFNRSLTYNPNNAQTQFYTIFAHNMLDEYSEADLFVQKCIEKYKADPANIENQWILTTLTEYYNIIRQNYNKHTTQKSKEHTKANISTTPLLMNMWPTHLEFTELSYATYCKDHLSSVPLWTFIDEYDDTNKTGYYGIVVQHNETKEMVIAHRGTTFDVNNASLLADYSLFTLVTPGQFQVAQEFNDKIRRQMDPKRILWHTGHSLGGAIAEFLVANETLFKQEPLSFAVTFDSPGIMESLKEHHHSSNIKQSLPRSDEFPVIGYLSAPNIVNTMGTHIGLTLRLSPAPPVLNEYHPLMKGFYDLITTQLNHLKGIIDIFVAQLFQQMHWHNLATIIECLKLWPNKSGLPAIIKPVIKWPKGFQELVGFLNLAYQHNLTTLDISNYLDKSQEILNIFKRSNYQVFDSQEYPLAVLPLELWNSKKQYFMEKFINNDFKKKHVTIQLNSDCELVKFVGADGVRSIFDILHWKTHHSYMDMKVIALNESAIPTYYEQIHKINILNIYTLFSLVDLDNCFLSSVDSPK